METSAQGTALIKQHESLRLKAYRCPAGVPTIGYGHTGKNVFIGDVITLEVANSLLKYDLRQSEDVVSRLCPGINQSQFDALVSFVFNLGVGNFSQSTLLKKVQRNPNDPTIAAEFAKWVYATVNGKKQQLPGLVKRRDEEATLYFS